MSDVRALLKAKRQEARISHPLASYSSTGQLRCIACGTVVKQAASWNGHVGSKAHRINAVKLKEAEQARQRQETMPVKRKPDTDEDADEDEMEDADMTPVLKKRKTESTDLEEGSAARRPPVQGFPDDFFSDPSKAPPPSSSDGEEEDSEMNQNTEEAASQSVAADDEWERFQMAVLNPPTDEERREAFERATVVAEPVFASETPEGFPPALSSDQDAHGEPQAALSEEELRQRKEQEERELIMDRLMEEERAQEEADAKVSMLKSKLDALKRKREAAKAARTSKMT